MDVSLYQAAAAMSATAQWQDMIAENLSASSVPGARRQEMSFSDVQAGYASNVAGGDGTGFYLPMASQVTNFSPGEARPTGNNMDFALEGPGFFAIQTPDGQTLYSRDGEFRLNSKGQVTTKNGSLVLSNDGPIHINPNNPNAITVSASGDISQGDQVVGKLRTVEFKDPKQVTMISSGLFANNNPAVPPVTSTSTKVRQGFIEGSNASPTTEMASMITAMRMFESNQKVLQMQSDRMSRVISDLGGTSSS